MQVAADHDQNQLMSIESTIDRDSRPGADVTTPLLLDIFILVRSFSMRRLHRHAPLALHCLDIAYPPLLAEGLESSLSFCKTILWSFRRSERPAVHEPRV